VLERLDARAVPAIPAAAAGKGDPGEPRPTPTPTPTATPTPTTPGNTVLSTYRVRPGDTLWRIARRLYGSGHYYRLIAVHNPRLHPDRLEVGDALQVVSDLPRALQVYGEMMLHATWAANRTAEPHQRRNVAVPPVAQGGPSSRPHGTYTQ
jgi:hypothetical protein